ncbi:adenine-specific methyltransferase [Pseudoalteromonas phage H101]|uniref:Adenine-specific methyltransferase n=1 Tax=Pseudoalteromonas phage H101 TaxID=1654919 RepID=A0A0H4INW5_9CAUD|nr:adenine-specific methyltransferase [Pseudoalteromonas phage H101]AKO61007.1 adenine-specific methyltransferase [Pseudoalteromonas phage H101]
MDYKYTSDKGNNIWLMQGDCLERMKEIPDGSVDMIMCDPPYGKISCKWDSVIPLEPMWEQLKRIIKPNGAIVITAAQPFTSVLVSSNLKMFKYDWVWKKPKGTGHLNAKKQPMRDKEDIIVFYQKQCTYNPQMLVGTPYKDKAGKDHSDVSSMTNSYGSYTNKRNDNTGFRYPKQVQDFPVVERNTIHPTQKPVALMEYLIKTYTNGGETILDFTMGSGSTIKAANNLNRNAIGIEMGHCEKKGHEYEGMEWTDVVRDCVK